MRLPRFLSEPLLHFTLLGGLVFVVHRAVAGQGERPTLEVSPATQRELAQLFEHRQGREPSAEERKKLLERYVEDEALFREGLRLSLVQSDPMLRAQLIARVRRLLQAEVSEQPPSDEELRAFYEQHRAEYAIPETVSFREYLLPGGPNARDAARELSLSLQRGQDPDPTTVPAPTDYTRRSQAELSEHHGADLARRIWTLPTGVWRELAASDGIHVIRVDEHAPSAEQPFDDLRELLRAEQRKERMSRAFQNEVARLTAQWRVRIAEGS